MVATNQKTTKYIQRIKRKQPYKTLKKTSKPQRKRARKRAETKNYKDDQKQLTK